MQKVERDKSGMLLSAVTHEIRNPLTLIGSYLQMLGKQYPEVEENAYWRIIESEMKHLNRLLNDFSLYQNEMSIHMELTPMSDWLGAYIETILPLFGDFSRVELHTEISEDLPVISVDGNRIRQLLDNLIRNALEAIEQKRLSDREAAAAEEKPTVGEGAADKNRSENGDQITLSAFMKGNDLCIEVTDTGCGIRKEQEAALFTPFVTGKAAGTGLGLAICRNIAQAHGGSIILTGSFGGKTTFRVLLPAENRR